MLDLVLTVTVQPVVKEYHLHHPIFTRCDYPPFHHGGQLSK